MSTPPLNIAIVGCGAITEQGHLPAAARLAELRVTALIDRDQQRAASLAKTLGVAHVSDTIDAIPPETDAVIVAVPNHLHKTITLPLMERGLHVLVEKPLAMTSGECRVLTQTAADRGVSLTVGMVKRFLHASGLARDVLQNERLGAVEACDLREGTIFKWQAVSDHFFRKERSGGGVLMDRGVHTLDCLQWWCGPLALDSFQDDADGGVEANCELRLRLANGAPVFVDLSRTRDLRNTARFICQRGTLEVDLFQHRAWIEYKGSSYRFGGEVTRPTPDGDADTNVFRAQLRAWIKAIHGKPTIAANGVDGTDAIALIEACYQQRETLALPWEQPAA
ncbi:MAG: Gfo/Idh/MocA family oxidoreductase [Verrucomicrobia bacterium]|nr:Gfo/Idh/MocA family oxidoreductase [Verrucomicrobiota bacterium]